jgi:hypothetical protein
VSVPSPPSTKSSPRTPRYCVVAAPQVCGESGGVHEDHVRSVGTCDEGGTAHPGHHPLEPLVGRVPTVHREGARGEVADQSAVGGGVVEGEMVGSRVPVHRVALVQAAEIHLVLTGSP